MKSAKRVLLSCATVGLALAAQAMAARVTIQDRSTSGSTAANDTVEGLANMSQYGATTQTSPSILDNYVPETVTGFVNSVADPATVALLAQIASNDPRAVASSDGGLVLTANARNAASCIGRSRNARDCGDIGNPNVSDPFSAPFMAGVNVAGESTSETAGDVSSAFPGVSFVSAAAIIPDADPVAPEPPTFTLLSGVLAVLTVTRIRRRSAAH